MYTIPEHCPARIAHDSSQEIKDNIFNKARSLSDSSEILINHEYDFEDMPEGIPLEDPFYENLTRRNVTDSMIHTEITKGSTNNAAFNDSDKTVNNTNVIDKLIFVNKERKTGNKYNNNSIDNIKMSTGLNVVVIDDKLDISDETNHESNLNENIKIINNTGSFATLSSNSDNIIQDEETQKSKNEGIVSVQGVYNNAFDTNLNTQINTNVKFDEQNTKSEADNVVTKEPSVPNHRIEIRDDEHENHREVENPNLSNFHVISSDKDLDVPTGIEGPIPFVVFPPPNFIPPPNVRALDNVNPGSQNNVATFINYNTNLQTQPTHKEAPISLQNAPFSLQNAPISLQNAPFSRNYVLPSHLIPPPHYFAQYYKDAGWESYSNEANNQRYFSKSHKTLH